MILLITESLISMDLIDTDGLIIGFKKIRMVNKLKNYEWIDNKYYDI